MVGGQGVVVRGRIGGSKAVEAACVFYFGSRDPNVSSRLIAGQTRATGSELAMCWFTRLGPSSTTVVRWCHVVYLFIYIFFFYSLWKLIKAATVCSHPGRRDLRCVNQLTTAAGGNELIKKYKMRLRRRLRKRAEGILRLGLVLNWCQVGIIVWVTPVSIPTLGLWISSFDGAIRSLTWNYSSWLLIVLLGGGAGVSDCCPGIRWAKGPRRRGGEDSGGGGRAAHNVKGALSAPTDVKWAISKQRGGSGTEELVPHCYMGQEKKNSSEFESWLCFLESCFILMVRFMRRSCSKLIKTKANWYRADTRQSKLYKATEIESIPSY